MGAANERKGEREQHDYYATTPEAAKWLLDIENLTHTHAHTPMWECACGEGHLAKPLIEAGLDVRCTDLIDRGFGEGGVDFLKWSEPFDGDIVTNPPYRYAQEFIEHALELIPDGRHVYMFLKVQFLEGKRRRKMFDENPPKRVWVSSGRLQCGKNGVFSGSMVAYAWYVWEKGWHGDTVLKWFN